MELIRFPVSIKRRRKIYAPAVGSADFGSGAGTAVEARRCRRKLIEESRRVSSHSLAARSRRPALLPEVTNELVDQRNVVLPGYLHRATKAALNSKIQPHDLGVDEPRRLEPHCFNLSRGHGAGFWGLISSRCIGRMHQSPLS